MASLRDVITALAERPDVAGAVVVSDEGLVIAAALPAGLEADAIAAHAVGAVRASSELAASLGDMAPREVVAASERGVHVLLRLRNAATLLLIASPDADIGMLLHEFRRHAPALTALV